MDHHSFQFIVFTTNLLEMGSKTKFIQNPSRHAWKTKAEKDDVKHDDDQYYAKPRIHTVIIRKMVPVAGDHTK